MKTIYMRIQAPFAAFRWLQAGVYRATSPVIPYSATWGLALNLAAIETRDRSAETVVTKTRSDAPPLAIAIGEIGTAETASIYQQLHTYPVGNAGKEHAARTRGSKYWIAPARRELLVGLDCAIGLRGDDAVIDRIGPGLEGKWNGERYGLPSAGDNNFLIDRIEITNEAIAARWYLPVDETERPTTETRRLLIGIDREDSSRTTSQVFAPLETATTHVPAKAWIWTPRAP